MNYDREPLGNRRVLDFFINIQAFRYNWPRFEYFHQSLQPPDNQTRWKREKLITNTFRINAGFEHADHAFNLHFYSIKLKTFAASIHSVNPRHKRISYHEINFFPASCKARNVDLLANDVALERTAIVLIDCCDNNLKLNHQKAFIDSQN